MEDTFAIAVTTDDACTVVSVVGELDVATAPALREHLERAIDGGGLVVADLLGVTFIDSTALGVLIGALKRSESAGGGLRIAVAEPRILKIFEITGLTELFSIFPTLGEASAQ
jgi:anti-sigma B factor antagonist